MWIKSGLNGFYFKVGHPIMFLINNHVIKIRHNWVYMHFLESKIHIHWLWEKKTKKCVWKYTNLLHYNRCKPPFFRGVVTLFVVNVSGYCNRVGRQMVWFA